ncbi:MAG TPA: OB-fold nucleic acid binding domain-containing protein, partial [Methylomirabilota bacterium]|nr:OB-fold nucleic acid binding domain-containing protein [Methylomirabilota bacterium]
HGRARITYEHPAMETFTRETYGIMVYQEQIMQIASEMAGFTMGEADTLRRAMGKKDRDLMARQREKFLAGCKERGTTAAKAEHVWELMEKFAGYGFNKCLGADSMIEMADGTRKPITAIRDGDVVVTKDGPFPARRVRPSGMRVVGRLALANGMAVRCTPDHPIFTQRGWVNAEELVETDAVAVLDVVAAADLRVAARQRTAAGLQATSVSDVPIDWTFRLAFTPETAEPTYDFEVPGAHSFIANGVVVHNSHAAAYALVAYQTAYFKANYPVEFMAALLTSEMGDTDKIVKYIDECRAMGIRVQPPDVDVSQVRFSVAGDTVRFGLAAIKNVGEAAMESILKTRAADGAFRTLEDFCARVDLRLVNRRVIESLIKAGAFDSLGLPRAHLLTQCDVALESGQRQQREKAEGQGSFFDLLPSPAPAPRPSEATATAVVPEWDDDQRLAYEKEVLGFYVSGHPLARFEGVAESLGVTTSSELAGRSHGARVTLFGHVAALKETATKSGNRMAFFTLEDMAGTVEVTVFPEPYKAAGPLLRGREPVVVRGRVDDSDKGRVVLAEDVRPLDQSLATGGRPRNGGEPTACRVRVRGHGDVGATLAALHRLCEAHAGTVPVFLHLLLPGHEVVVRARAVAVDASAGLLAGLEDLLGTGSAVIEHAGRA